MPGGGIVDADLPWLEPDTSLGMLTRYFAAYNLVCGPVVDAQHHLLGAVTVDDVLDHLLPHDWRATNRELALDGAGGRSWATRRRGRGCIPRVARDWSRHGWTPRP